MPTSTGSDNVQGAGFVDATASSSGELRPISGRWSG